MTEFVHRDGKEVSVVGSRKHVAVVNAAASILPGVGQDDDVLVGQTAQTIVQRFDLQRGEITIAVEGVEMRRQRRPLPHAIMGNAHSGILTCQGHSTHIETIAIIAEGRILQNLITRRFRIGKKLLLLGRSVSLGYDHQINTCLLLIPTVYPSPRRGRSLNRADQNVIDLHRVTHCAHRSSLIVEQRNRHLHISARKGE